MTSSEFDGGPLAWLARRDGTVVVGHGPFHQTAIAPRNGVAFFISDFLLENPQPWHVPARHRILDAATFASLAGRAATPAAVEWRPPEAAGFAAVFQEILAAIDRGVVEKTVPVVTEAGHCTVDPTAAIASAMARRARPLQSYGRIADGHGFAGATPELLFKLDGTTLETMALAGTARTEDLDAFAVDEKEIREHEFVATTLTTRLAEYGEVARSPRETLNLGPIVHFHSPIRVRLHQSLDPVPLVRSLHPTPALGPLPRTPETLAQLARWRSQLDAPLEFGAPFGVWHDGAFEAVVAIRGIWWHGRDLRLPSGCGVIEASRLVNEWRELRLKREAVLRFLND